MGVLALLLLALVPLTGGDLRRLASLQLRSVPLLPLALGLQVLVVSIAPNLPRPVTVGLHLVSYLLAAAFLVRNVRVPGLGLLGLGAACNGVTIALNGGTLPASRSAMERAGLHLDPDAFTNSGPLAHPRLPWLGDVFAVPSWVPLANVFSVGDVLILLGAAWLLLGVCRPPRVRRPAHQDPLLALPPVELVGMLEQAWAEARALREELRAHQAARPGREAEPDAAPRGTSSSGGLLRSDAGAGGGAAVGAVPVPRPSQVPGPVLRERRPA